MELIDRLLLCTVAAYESRQGTGPTVRELAADLGIPADFGHEHLVERLQREVAEERVSHRRGRFTLTTIGRLALDADEARRPAPLRAEPLAEPTSSAQAPAFPAQPTSCHSRPPWRSTRSR